MKKHGEISTYFHLKHHCGKEVGHLSVQWIQTKTTWLPTLCKQTTKVAAGKKRGKFNLICNTYLGSYMRAHVSLNLLNELGEKR